MSRMLLRACVLVLSILLFVSAAISQTASTTVWQKIDADGLFTFRLPQGFTKTGMTGIENYLGEYYKGETRFLFIHSATASYSYEDRRQPEMQGYQETETQIDGRRANIRIFWLDENGERRYRAELNIGDWPTNDVELYMELESKNPADIEMAKAIFNSVDFP